MYVFFRFRGVFGGVTVEVEQCFPPPASTLHSDSCTWHHWEVTCSVWTLWVKKIPNFSSNCFVILFIQGHFETGSTLLSDKCSSCPRTVERSCGRTVETSRSSHHQTPPLVRWWSARWMETSAASATQGHWWGAELRLLCFSTMLQCFTHALA